MDEDSKADRATAPRRGVTIPPGEPESVATLAAREVEQHKALIFAEAKQLARQESDLRRLRHLRSDRRSLRGQLAECEREIAELVNSLPRHLTIE